MVQHNQNRKKKAAGKKYLQKSSVGRRYRLTFTIGFSSNACPVINPLPSPGPFH